MSRQYCLLAEGDIGAHIFTSVNSSVRLAYFHTNRQNGNGNSLKKRRQQNYNANRHQSPRSGTTFEHLSASRPPLFFHWSLPLSNDDRLWSGEGSVFKSRKRRSNDDGVFLFSALFWTTSHFYERHSFLIQSWMKQDDRIWCAAGVSYLKRYESTTTLLVKFCFPISLVRIKTNRELYLSPKEGNPNRMEGRRPGNDRIWMVGGLLRWGFNCVYVRVYGTQYCLHN